MAKRVLLIEDEPHIAEAIRYILTRDGWSVASHNEGAGAIEAIRREAPEVLVLDVMLPGRTGYEILGDLRADPALAGLPVLVLSARGTDVDCMKAEGARGDTSGGSGLTRFLAKPFANDDVVTTLRQMAGP